MRNCSFHLYSKCLFSFGIREKSEGGVINSLIVTDIGILLQKKANICRFTSRMPFSGLCKSLPFCGNLFHTFSEVIYPSRGINYHEKRSKALSSLFLFVCYQQNSLKKAFFTCPSRPQLNCIFSNTYENIEIWFFTALKISCLDRA